MKTQGLENWRDFNRQWPKQGRYNHSFYWQGDAYRTEAAGTVDCQGRARALAHALTNVAAELLPGELLGGSRRGYCFMQELPAGVTTADYDNAIAADEARGRRTFTAGWDHTTADYETLLAIGIGGLRKRVADSGEEHEGAPERLAFLESMDTVLSALVDFIGRFAASARRQGRAELASMLEHIRTQPPRDFLEAVMLVHYVNLVFVIERRYAQSLGRLDQYLLPFYEASKANGVSDEEMLEILCWLWTKLAELEEVSNICIGGLTAAGEDATNALSYLCLDATDRVHSPSTNLSARLHDGTSDDFHRACWRLIRTGIGFPALFNDHVTVAGLITHMGVPEEAARQYAMAGCVETILPGRQPAWSDSRFNMGKVLADFMASVAPEGFSSYDEFEAALFDRFRKQIREHVNMINVAIAKFPIAKFADPFLSVLMRDCIGRARDVNNGGAEFPRLHGVAAVGLATVADSLAAIKRVVFEDCLFGLAEVRDALQANFADREPMRQALLNWAPKYGNADDEVDAIAARLVEEVSSGCLEEDLAVVGGGKFVCLMAANVSNIGLGAEVGATPDGRQAGRPLSDAASPHFGRDRLGPTAFLRSVATPDYEKCFCGNVINMKFDPDTFQGEEGIERLLPVSKIMVKDRIPELQFNFSGNEQLLKAQENPEEYGNLVVRVSGFSSYFVTLDREVQEDVIRRRMNAAV